LFYAPHCHHCSAAGETRRTGPQLRAIAVIVCRLFVLYDGYELIVYCNVIPSLHKE
jgi:AAHS family benzoate transporter-like MFS transporter